MTEEADGIIPGTPANDRTPAQEYKVCIRSDGTKTVHTQRYARLLPGGDDAPPVYFRYDPGRVPHLRLRAARNPLDGEPFDPAVK